MWKEWDVVIHYLCTWIGAKGVGWPHHRLGVNHSWLCHHHGAHVGRLIEEKGKHDMINMLAPATSKKIRYQGLLLPFPSALTATLWQ